MALYLIQLSYTPQAWSALVANPQDRAKAVEGAIQSLGGKILHFWMAFGDFDAIGITEMPDSVSAAAFAIAVSAGGACRSFKTTPLLGTAEAQDAMRKASACGYKPVTA